MTAHLVLSPRAQSDLDEIWDYTESRWDDRQAESYIRQPQRDLETIAAHPSYGRPCPESRTGYRRYRSGSHVLFYRIAKTWWSLPAFSMNACISSGMCLEFRKAQPR